MKLFTMKLSTKPYTMRLSTNIMKLYMTLFIMKKKVIGRLELFVTTVVQTFLVMHQTILKNISQEGCLSYGDKEVWIVDKAEWDEKVLVKPAWDESSKSWMSSC